MADRQRRRLDPGRARRRHADESRASTFDFNGKSDNYPDIKLAYWVGGNPFAHHQDRNRMVKAWQKLETFIVHDFQWTATARHADIVLPATTTYERNDIEQVGDYSLQPHPGDEEGRRADVRGAQRLRHLRRRSPSGSARSKEFTEGKTRDGLDPLVLRGRR